MNCFEAKNDFVAFWQKTIAGERKAQLLAHLSRCEICDRAFRIFALTAPILYSQTEPDWSSSQVERVTNEFRPPVIGIRPTVWGLKKVLPAFVMAAAAVIALYFAAPPQMTFEDAIAADNATAEAASYPATDSIFGQELTAQGTTTADVADD
jgi:hypothetical protein